MNRRKKNDRSAIVSIATGIMIALSLSLLLAGILSLLLVNETFPMESTGVVIPIIHFLVSFISALLAGKRQNEKYAIICGSTSLCYCLLLLGCAVLFFESNFKALGLSVIMCVAGASAASLLCMRRTKRAKKKVLFL